MITITQEEFNSYTQEHFKEHPTHKGIYVGNRGTILSTRKGTGRHMNPYNGELHTIKSFNSKGYLYSSHFGFAHRLVAQTWIPNPDNLPEVNHKDEDKTNNVVMLNDDLSVNLELSNLEWISHRDNCNYGTRNERVALLLRGKTQSADTCAKKSAAMKGNQNAKGSTNKSTIGQKWYKDPITGKHIYYTPESE